MNRNSHNYQTASPLAESILASPTTVENMEGKSDVLLAALGSRL